jgi:hypothetical protein
MTRFGARAILLVASALSSGCGADEPLAPERVVASGPLEAGFGRASLAWRVGAKPGQVGTAALPERDAFFTQGASSLLSITHKPPAEMLPELTSFARGLLEERSATQPGQYSFFFEPGAGIELPPEANALVVRRGGVKIALVRADLYVMHEQLQRRVAALIEPETGIGRDALFLVATHNHSAAHALSPAPGVWTRADAFDPRHFVYASQRIADAILEADRNLRPAELRVARQTLGNVQHNVIGTDIVGFAPEEGAPSEPVTVGYPPDHFDPDLLLLRFDAPEGSPLGLLFVFGMHPESLHEGHGMTSGEWPTHVQARLRQRLGAEAIWLPGPLGDVEPDKSKVNPDHDFFRGDFESMDRMVGIITDSVESAWQAAGALPGDRAPALAQIARDVPGPVDYPLPDLAEVGFRVPMVRVAQDTSLMRIHLARLGDALLVGIPAEITTDLALNIKSRLDEPRGNVFQGWVFPENPAWVGERVARNFGDSEIDPARAAPLPMIVSHANGYFGYVVSRWEYENRRHYRQSMTFFGPGTADHIATAALALATELSGGVAASFERQPWHAIDLDGAREIEAYLAGLDALIPAAARAIPESDASQIGTLIELAAPGRFGWIGGTNDLEPPSVWLEQDPDGTGAWQIVAAGPSADIHLLFEAPDRWYAVWRHPRDLPGSLRFRCAGTYRGKLAGASAPDPLWDPDGKNQAYELVSPTF